MDCTFDNNTWNISDAGVERLMRTTLERILLGRVQPVITIIGFILNITFLYVVFKSKEMRTITNVYLSNLAIADTVFLVYTGTASFAEYMWSPIKSNVSFYRKGGNLGCAMHQVVNFTMYYTSLFLVAIVTFERYLAICHPLIHRRIASKSRTRNLSGGCWFLATLCGVFMIWIKGRYSESCYRWSSKYSYISNLFGICSGYVIFGNFPWKAHYILECGTFVVILCGKMYLFFCLNINPCFR